MLIFTYVAWAIIAIGALVTAVGLVYAVKYEAATRLPPESEEDEHLRHHLGTMAASVTIVGLLLCGVGVLFK